MNKIKRNPMNIKNLLKFAGLVLAAVLLHSCAKDYFSKEMGETKWNPNFSIPLASASFSLEDLLNQVDTDSLLEIDSDNFITAVYRDQLISVSAEEYIKLPDQNHTESQGLNISDSLILVGTGTVQIADTQVVSFDTGGDVDTDSIYMKSGTMSVNISSTFQHDANITLTVPEAKKNGVPLSLTVPLNYTGVVPISNSASEDLNGYVFDMTLGGTTSNEFEVIYTIDIINSGNTIYSTDAFTFDIDLTNLKFSKLFGYAGNAFLSPGEDTVSVGLFSSASDIVSFTLFDPKVNVSISNSYGMPVTASLTKFDAVNSDGTAYPINGGGIPDPLPIESPSINEVGQVKTTSFTLDKTNSNIDDVINETPDKIVYSISSQGNTGGTTNQNFVLDSSRFEVDVELLMPLWGTATGFNIQDTSEFGLDDIEELESLMIRTFIENGFPIELEFQVYFTDTFYTVLDSLSAPAILLPSAAVNATTGKVITPASRTIDVTLPRTKLDNITGAKYMILSAKASTLNNGTENVKIYSDYELDIRMGVQAELNVTLE